MEADIITRSRRRELGILTESEDDTNQSSSGRRGRLSPQRKTQRNPQNGATLSEESTSGNNREVESHFEAGDLPQLLQQQHEIPQENTMLKMFEEMRDEIGSTLKRAIMDVVQTTQQQNNVSRRQNSYDDIPQRDQVREPRERSRRFVSPGYSSSEDEINSTTSYASHRQRNQYRRNQTGSKLPPFTGREQWKVWINRFAEVARLRGWNNEEKLEEILPRLQGPAGEFVYGQLSHRIRTDYGTLLKELNSRFRVVETCKTFGAQFSNRGQKHVETVEEYAAELKRLYDKAHANRDQETRREDLLRRFLDGLADDRTRFHVEYVKDPVDIDEAVYEVVNFQETRRRPTGKEMGPDGRNRRPTRSVRNYSYESMEQDEYSEVSTDEEDNTNFGENRVARAPLRINKNKPIKKETPKEEATDKSSKSEKNSKEFNTKEGNDPGKDNNKGNMENQDLTTVLQQINERLDKLEKGSKVQGRPANTRNNNSGISGRSPYQSANNPQKFGQSPPTQRNWNCYTCNQEGHFARECPNAPWMIGQMQLAAQPPMGPSMMNIPSSQRQSNSVRFDTSLSQKENRSN